MDPTPLGPAEARVLLAPNRAAGREALPSAARFLLATGALRATRHDEKTRWGTRRRICLDVVPGRPTGAPHLDALRDALGAATADRRCLAPTEVMQRMQRAFGVGYGRFAALIYADLERRGLLRRVERRALGLFRVARWEQTADGEAAALALEGRLADARTIPELLGHDPARAAAVAAGIGGLLLAAEELRPHYSELAEALRTYGRKEDGDATTIIAAGMDTGDMAGDGPRTGWDVGLDALTDVDWAGALDVLDGAFDALDGAFDGGGADGGGDGGDGGGGGD